MPLGTIIGKTTTLGFKFLAEGDAKKFQYVELPHEQTKILAQVIEIEKDNTGTTAQCIIIGQQEQNTLKPVRTPPQPSSPVEMASDEFIRNTLGLEKKEGAYVGTLNGKEHIPVYLDLNKLLSKHVVILAKTGAGKSYVTGVLLEEILDRNIPTFIIDPHGEYSTLKYPNTEAKEPLQKHHLMPKPYNIQEYSPNVQDVPTAKQLKLSNKNLNANELMHLLPAKLSNAQLSVLYSALRNMQGALNFQDIIMGLEAEDSNIKYTIINILDYLQRLNLFSEAPTRLTELIHPGKATILNFKGVPSDIQEIIVHKLATDLFDARKKGNIPPFFFVLEEAQNYCPERSFGEAKSSRIIRQIASEGRKFGISLAVISQRPSRVDKTVISQAGTQIILKVTNPNDIKAIENSVEGLTLETGKEIRNIPIGTAMITGIADLPLLVDIRPRKSKHGGTGVSIIGSELGLIEDEGEEENLEIVKEVEQYDGGLLPLVKPHTSLNDLKLIHGKKFNTLLTACLSIHVEQGKEEFHLLINLTNNQFIVDVDTGKNAILQFPNLQLSPNQQRVFDIALKQPTFKPAELFAKSGLQFSEIYDTINILTSKGIFAKKNDAYTLAPGIQDLMNIKPLACYTDVEYGKIAFDKKISAKTNPHELVNLIGKFATIKNEKECWLVSYVPAT